MIGLLWQQFMTIAPKKLQVLGDDLLTTNLDRLNKAIDQKSANAILIKANQNWLGYINFKCIKAG